MTCREFEEQLDRVLWEPGTVSTSSARRPFELPAAVRGHANHCTACQERLKEWRQLAIVLSGPVALPGVPLPAGFTERTVSAMKAMHGEMLSGRPLSEDGDFVSPPRRKTSHWMRWALAAGILATVASAASLRSSRLGSDTPEPEEIGLAVRPTIEKIETVDTPAVRESVAVKPPAPSKVNAAPSTPPALDSEADYLAVLENDFGNLINRVNRSANTSRQRRGRRNHYTATSFTNGLRVPVNHFTRVSRQATERLQNQLGPLTASAAGAFSFMLPPDSEVLE